MPKKPPVNEPLPAPNLEDPKDMDKPLARCTECDREVEHYNTFVMPTNETRVVCWECLQRQEKGFNAKRDFRRDSRAGRHSQIDGDPQDNRIPRRSTRPGGTARHEV